MDNDFYFVQKDLLRKLEILPFKDKNRKNSPAKQKKKYQLRLHNSWLKATFINVNCLSLRVPAATFVELYAHADVKNASYSQTVAPLHSLPLSGIIERMFLAPSFFFVYSFWRKKSVKNVERWFACVRFFFFNHPTSMFLSVKVLSFLAVDCLISILVSLSSLQVLGHRIGWKVGYGGLFNNIKEPR